MMLSVGNAKLSQKIAIFNLPPIITCPAWEQCYRTCYGMKAWRLYPAFRAKCLDNMAQAEAADFITRMVVEIDFLHQEEGVKFVRIHSSGDFYSLDYYHRWIEIACRCPHVIFYAYTKAIDNVISKKPRPDNLIIHCSLVGGQPNYGTAEAMQDLAAHCHGFICPDSKGYDGAHCGETCTHCMHRQPGPILFIKH